MDDFYYNGRLREVVSDLRQKSCAIEHWQRCRGDGCDWSSMPCLRRLHWVEDVRGDRNETWRPVFRRGDDEEDDGAECGSVTRMIRAMKDDVETTETSKEQEQSNTEKEPAEKSGASARKRRRCQGQIGKIEKQHQHFWGRVADKELCPRRLLDKSRDSSESPGHEAESTGSGQV